MTATAHTIGPGEAVKTSLALLGAAFNRPVDKAMATAYWIALRDLAPEEISLATERALAGCKFMPAPAELRGLAGKNPAAAVAEAWEAVRRAVDEHDYTASVDFGPVANAVVRNIGGWQRLCSLPLEQLNVWARKEFERVYELLSPKDPAILNGEPHRGAFGGRPVRIAIAGKLPPRQLREDGGSSAGQLRSVVRELAEAKSG